MYDTIVYYTEYSELSSFTEKRENRCKRVAEFVERFNAQQIGPYPQSVQYQMHRIKEDVERLRIMKASMSEVFEGHRQLQVLTKSFINSERLNNTDVNKLFMAMKREQYVRLEALESFGMKRDSVLISIQEHIDDFLLAYTLKEKTLVLLRKDASIDLVRMFDVFLCLGESGLTPLLPKILDFYMQIIFSGVVLINEHMILSAFAKIRGTRK